MKKLSQLALCSALSLMSTWASCQAAPDLEPDRPAVLGAPAAPPAAPAASAAEAAKMPPIGPVGDDADINAAPRPSGANAVPFVAPIGVPVGSASLKRPESQGKLSVVFAADSFFDWDKHDLKPEGVAKLDRLAAKLRQLAINVTEVRVYGHTDSDGSVEYNVKLSQRRAETVKQQLIARGIPETLITALGRGKTYPVADNATVEGRAMNRRVEIEIGGTDFSFRPKVN
jgi:OOP family OmpA-OmpF porin